jgi:glycosyltransferase involved in cell wall biosynthesis
MTRDLDGLVPQISVIVNIWGKDSPISLKRSLSSIKSQTTKPSEVIVVVDGPINDLLEKVVAEFQKDNDFEVRIIRILEPTGLWNGRNKGIEVAKNEFIAVHDADDVMHPMRLEIQLREFELGNIDVLGSPVLEFDCVSEVIRGLRCLGPTGKVSKSLLWQNIINHSSVTFRKSAVIKAGGYRDVHLAEDYDLWLRMYALGYEIVNSKYVLQALSIDQDFINRRGGFKFIKSELQIHRVVRSTEVLKNIELLLRLVLRLIFRLGPGWLRQLFKRIRQIKDLNSNYTKLNEFITLQPMSMN